MDDSEQTASNTSDKCRHDSLDERFQRDYQTLHYIAQARLRRDGGLALFDSSSLVHECYIKLRMSRTTEYGERAAFLAYASRTMQSVLVDAVRQRATQRRGADGIDYVASYDEAELERTLATTPDPALLFDIRRVFERLSCDEPRATQAASLHFLVGAPLEEIAETLGVNARTVRRDCAKAKAMLAFALA